MLLLTVLAIALAITLIAMFWARRLADRRNRHVGGWTLATAILPPVVLVLWALPARSRG
jgi:hypothetical protein